MEARSIETNKAPGPTLSHDLAAAGLADVISMIDAAGVVTFQFGATDAQIAAVVAVIAAHDPSIQEPPATPDPVAAFRWDPGKKIGPTIFAELAAAGLGDVKMGFPGDLSGDPLEFDVDMTADQIAAIKAVVAAHDPTSPANARAGDLVAIDAMRDAKLNAGYLDVGTGKAFALDAKSQSNFGNVATAAAVASMPGAPATTFDLIPIDNQTIKGLSPADTLAILMRLFAYGSAVVIHARDLKNQILAGGDPDTSTGWPS